MRYKNIIKAMIFFIIGTLISLYIACIGITNGNFHICIAACINELMLLAFLYMGLAHKKYGKFVINTSDPKKDIYTVQLDNVTSLTNKDEIVLEVCVDNNRSPQ